MNRREISEFALLITTEYGDITKSKKFDPVLKQLSPSQFPAFCGFIKMFRKKRKIKIKDFLKYQREVISALDKKRVYKRYRNILFNQIKKVTQSDIITIRERSKYSPIWDFAVKYYIFTGIMPNPTRKFRIIPDTKGNRWNWKMYIQVYGDTSYKDILEKYSWDFIKQYKKIVFKVKRRYSNKTSIEPIYDKENNILKIPIYPDTAQAEIKNVWPKVKIIQKFLSGAGFKYNKPMRFFKKRVETANEIKQNRKTYSRRSKKFYQRDAQRKRRIIEKGYVEAFQKKRIVLLTCESCEDYKTCKLDEVKQNRRCRYYKR